VRKMMWAMWSFAQRAILDGREQKAERLDG